MTSKELINSYLKDNKITKCETVDEECLHDGEIRSVKHTKTSGSRNYCNMFTMNKATTVDGAKKLRKLIRDAS